VLFRSQQQLQHTRPYATTVRFDRENFRIGEHLHQWYTSRLKPGKSKFLTWMQNTKYKFQVPGFKFQVLIISYRLPVTGYQLPVAGRLQVSGCRLQVAGYKGNTCDREAKNRRPCNLELVTCNYNISRLPFHVSGFITIDHSP
jgi:hypothetical protein